MTDNKRNGKIVTFYSYKGGTGRSMALANIAWIFASCGLRVLTIDWDLEAPGLHRYFEPFLKDKKLERSTGLIDFVMQFAAAAVSGQYREADAEWYLSFSNLLSHAMPVNWDFPNGGVLDLVPAGRQDASYSNRVNRFNWQDFYELLGGGVLLEAVKQKLRELYDYVLIDSRTGVSDTSGICTVQMPDEIVCCFTLNRQGMYGAAAAAASAQAQRTTKDGVCALKVWPVPMRVENSEKDRLEVAHAMARTTFSPFMQHLRPTEIDDYWGDISVTYEPFYAYEEVLAIFKDRPKDSYSLLSSMQTIAQRLHGQRVLPFRPMDEIKKSEGLLAFTARSAWDYLDEFKLMGAEYERIRSLMIAGDDRTGLMEQLVARVQILRGGRDSGEVAQHLFAQKKDGCRVVALALARSEPQRRHTTMALEGISESRSAFEQYHALLLMNQLMNLIDPSTMPQIGSALQNQLGRKITNQDHSRWSLASELLASTQSYSVIESPTPNLRSSHTAWIGKNLIELNEIHPVKRQPRYDDPTESHGPYLISRGPHHVALPRAFRISKYLITNRLYAEFVNASGYEQDALWSVPRRLRGQFFTSDRDTLGPGGWPGQTGFAAGEEEFPVSEISFIEVWAFVRWLNQQHPAEPGWQWIIPLEDLWEYAARGEAGLIYPWGDVFGAGNCNSQESGIGHATEGSRFELALSPSGCADMAGNLWEFVSAYDGDSNFCTLRGGSYGNNSSEVRSYLRLIRVPPLHRAPDFGFRLAQTQQAGGDNPPNV